MLNIPPAWRRAALLGHAPEATVTAAHRKRVCRREQQLAKRHCRGLHASFRSAEGAGRERGLQYSEPTGS